MAIGLFAFILIFSTIPLFRDYEPTRLLVTYIWRKISNSEPSGRSLSVLKIVACANHVWISTQSAGVVFTIMFFVAVIRDQACVFVSRKLLFWQNNRRSLGFFQCVKIYNELQLLIRIGNNIVYKFVTILATYGVVAAAWGGYVMLVMYKQFPFVLYISCSGVFVFCLTVNFLLVTLAGILNENGNKFLIYWRGKLATRKYKILYRSLPELGLALGFVYPVTFKTALVLMDAMIYSCITLVLMKLNDGQSWR